MELKLCSEMNQSTYKMRAIKKEKIEPNCSENNEESYRNLSFAGKQEIIETKNDEIHVETGVLQNITSWKTYPLYCCLCPYSTYKFPVLTTHAKTKHALEIENINKMHYQCVDCKKICKTYCKFLNHVRNHHPNLELCCDICNEFFESYKDLSRHHLKHKETIDSLQPFVRYCTLCSKVCPTRISINKHILTHDGALECQVCEKSFKCLKYLKRHMEQHDATKYACDFCEKTFARHFNKICHERTHTGERPYKCDKCNKRFSNSSTWKNHERTHTGELPYKCEECATSFRHFDSLKEHKRTHSNEKPYHCKTCVKNFRYRKSLNRHMREQHTNRQDVKTKTLPLKKRPTNDIKIENVEVEKPNQIDTKQNNLKCEKCKEKFRSTRIFKLHNCI